MMDHIVSHLLSWRAIFGCSLPLVVAIFDCSLPLAVAIFGCSLPLAVAIFDSLPVAVAIFLVIWQLRLRKIAIFVEVVEFAPPFHQWKPQWKKTQRQSSAVSGAATKHCPHPRRRSLVFYFLQVTLFFGSGFKTQTTGTLKLKKIHHHHSSPSLVS